MVYLFSKFDEMCLSKLSNHREIILLPISDCGLDLECGYLTLMGDSPSHYALSFGEVFFKFA